MAGPHTAFLRAFNVGFGDCFLLSFVYAADKKRHVLIDFGSTRPPPGAASNHLVKIAEKIRDLTNGKLDVVIATHRHKDHISGFATAANKKGSGDIIASLKPEVVVQPWTEDPATPENATGPKAMKSALKAMSALSAKVWSYARKLDADRMRRLGITEGERAFLSFAGENNISNKSAVLNLMKMGKLKAKYIQADEMLDLKAILPGITIDVLGPPTVDQHAAVAHQSPNNPDEYWFSVAKQGAGSSAKIKPLFAKFAAPLPPYAGWLAHRMNKMQKDSLMGMVRALDDAMNNTSLILLFKCGGKSFLFPGDAQWENWQYALSKPEYVEALKSVDLYKVGHHGSRNATPKTLWKLFEHKSKTKTTKGRLVTVMSTLHGVHGESAATAVPSSSLSTELEHDSHHHTTEVVELDKLYDEIEFTL